MGDEQKSGDPGAFEYEPLLDDSVQPPAEEFSNPPGISRGDCDEEQGPQGDSTCDVEVTAQVEDLFLEETKPGFGIPGFEGEEDGGG